ncbi:hypothetical protein TMEN_2371 [Trichophyton mentagrophytes]|nr:hypothetical protein TMEN_2371 [Trichophyton mentagrophytes]
MDHDLQAAIDASLRDAVRSQTNLQRRKSSVVDLTGDSDGDASAARRDGKAAEKEEEEEEEEEAGDDDSDAELKRAIQLSLQSGRGPEHETIDVDALEAGKATDTPEPKKTASSWIAGFDRKKMEEERLARLAKKRRTGEDGSALALPAARPLKASRREPPSGSSSSFAKISIPPATATMAAKSAPGVPSTEPSIQFPAGAVKKTWAFRCERKDDIKLEEVLQPSDLELAVLSSFLWDMDWLLMKFTNPRTRFLFIMGAKGEERREQLLRETASMSRIRLCFPPMDGEVNCMHSKLMLLFHANHLRIVIPSANLDPYDWGEEGGVMENASSVGSLTATFLQNLYWSAQGDNGTKQLSARAGNPRSSSKSSSGNNNNNNKSSGRVDDDWTGRMKVYFPSRETVCSSRGGVSAAGTLCLMSKWYNSPMFPRDVMRDNRSVLYVRPEGEARKGESRSADCAGWAYVGSANLSESAWGRLVIDRKTKQAKLNCRNWESGVVVPVGRVEEDGTERGASAEAAAGGAAAEAETEAELSRVFRAAVPVPMQEPGREYAEDEQPWFYLEHFHGDNNE